eukprot:2534809-Prymnesium_polylepis.1
MACGVLLLRLPAAPADEPPPSAGLSGWPWAEEDVLVITPDAASAPENEDDDDEFAGAAKQRKPKTKAELQAQLAERDPYKLLELDELRWR